MKCVSRFFPAAIVLLSTAGASDTLGATQIVSNVDTYVVRSVTWPVSKAPVRPETLLGAAVGERFCNALRCVVVAKSGENKAALQTLENGGAINVEPLPDAHALFFQKSRFDAASATFDRDFPGRLEPVAASDMIQVVVVFKSYPERAWLDQIEALGLTALEPVPAMGFSLYGSRAVIATLEARFPFVYSVVSLPPGLKRFNVDDPPKTDDLGPARTTVVMVTKARDVVIGLMTSAAGSRPSLVFRTGASEAYAGRFSLSDALAFSALPEVLSVYRETVPSGPSDERSSRIVAGDFQTPSSSWPASLGSNSAPPPYYQYYWDRFQTQLSGLGGNFDLSNQVLGFLDTGVDGGLQQGGQAYCPPHLRTPSYDPGDPTNAAGCRLTFTTDLTGRYDYADQRGDDLYYHGTFTTSIAAGFAGNYSSGRDAGGSYAFTQGVAQGAKVAMCQFFRLCGQSYRYVGEAQPFGDLGTNNVDIERRLRYALVELGSNGTFPDSGGRSGPAARIFNHSWNTCDLVYEPTSVLLDQATRSLAAVHFDFSANPNSPNVYSGPAAQSLHVVSAGNFPNCYGYPAWSDRQVTAPAVAKNVIAVGASETYNQENYTAGCSDNGAGYADNPHQVTDFSRFGYPNQRLRPDLVAPGTRSYGPVSVEYLSGCGGNPCNMNLTSSNPARYGWSDGTSFAAPVVTGSAALAAEWLRTLGFTGASPALIKATLINAARSLTSIQSCWTGCGNCCASCGDMRPSPDQYQGWGGVSLDRLFRSSSNYYFYDQGTTFTSPSQYYSRTVTIADTSKDVNITLAWTDRASDTRTDQSVNLVNDLDLYAVVFYGGQGYTWVGNNYYYNRDACSRDGYSLRNPSPVVYDRKNNVERINIRASDIPAGATQITIQVVANSLTGDGIDPTSNSTFRQDFALSVENAQ